MVLALSHYVIWFVSGILGASPLFFFFSNAFIVIISLVRNMRERPLWRWGATGANAES